MEGGWNKKNEREKEKLWMDGRGGKGGGGLWLRGWGGDKGEGGRENIQNLLL